jgi:hypothetical protein
MGLYLKVAPGVRVGRSTAPQHGAAARRRRTDRRYLEQAVRTAGP